MKARITILTALILIGCAGPLDMAKDARDCGLRSYCSATNVFARYSGPSYKFNVSLDLIVVGKKTQYPSGQARSKAALGYFTAPPDKIYLYVRSHNGRIVVNEAVLGHEVLEYLVYNYPGYFLQPGEMYHGHP